MRKNEAQADTGSKEYKAEALRKRIFMIIQLGNRSDVPSRLFDYGLVTVILINIFCMFMYTFQEFSAWFPAIRIVELITLAVFIVEYALRIWTADLLYPHETRRGAVWHFLLSFDGVVDLLTILPFFYLSGFVVFRMLRVARIFRLFRINNTYDSFNVITTVLYQKRNQIMSSVFLIVIMMLGSSICMYSVEHEAQPEVFRNAFSGIWWSMSTMLTVGYGDITPVTPLGRLMAIVIAFLGVGVVAIPTGIISAGFVEQYTHVQNTMLTQDLTIQTMTVDLDSRWIGLSRAEIEEKYHIILVAAKRDGFIQPFNGEYRVKIGDCLALYRESAEEKSVKKH